MSSCEAKTKSLLNIENVKYQRKFSEILVAFPDIHKAPI